MKQRRNATIAYLLITGMMVLFSGCGNKTVKPPYNLNENTTDCISIPYDEQDGVKTIPVKINGITMNMIYDTGCSGVHLSLNEVQTLAKNGKLAQEDILGASYATIADGSIVQNGMINIRTIEIGDKENQLTLENIQASVALNQMAPILLGNAVLDELASVEVDNIGKTINFHKK